MPTVPTRLDARTAGTSIPVTVEREQQLYDYEHDMLRHRKDLPYECPTCEAGLRYLTYTLDGGRLLHSTSDSCTERCDTEYANGHHDDVILAARRYADAEEIRSAERAMENSSSDSSPAERNEAMARMQRLK